MYYFVYEASQVRSLCLPVSVISEAHAYMSTTFVSRVLQVAATMWFYDRLVPGQKEIWLFAIVMM